MKKCLALAASLWLVACGGGGGGYGGGGGSSSTAGLMYTIGGTVSGLNPGGTLVLQNNGTDNLSITQNGTFTFHTAISYLNGYDVTVLTQPTGQTCTLAGATGGYTGMSVTTVQVTCH